MRNAWQLAAPQPGPLYPLQSLKSIGIVNRIIWLVGAVVIILFVLGYFGVR